MAFPLKKLVENTVFSPCKVDHDQEQQLSDGYRTLELGQEAAKLGQEASTKLLEGWKVFKEVASWRRVFESLVTSRPPSAGCVRWNECASGMTCEVYECHVAEDISELFDNCKVYTQ